MQKESLRQQASQMMESVMSSISKAQDEYELSKSAEAELEQVYYSKFQSYSLGLGSLLDALTAHAQLTQASIARVNAAMDLSNQRVSLSRAMLANQFADIKGCVAEAQAPKNSGNGGGWFPGGDTANEGKQPTNQKTIFDVCTEGGSKP